MPFLRDFDLLARLGQLRQQASGAPLGALTVHQVLAFQSVNGEASAIAVLLEPMVALLLDVPEDDLRSDNPALRALATILAHPDADRAALDRLPPERRARVEQALAEQTPEWDPDRLEWQLVAYLKARAGDVALDPKSDLLQQELPERHQRYVWNAAIDLAVLRAAGLLGPRA